MLRHNTSEIRLLIICRLLFLDALIIAVMTLRYFWCQTENAVNNFGRRSHRSRQNPQTNSYIMVNCHVKRQWISKIAKIQRALCWLWRYSNTLECIYKIYCHRSAKHWVYCPIPILFCSCCWPSKLWKRQRMHSDEFCEWDSLQRYHCYFSGQHVEDDELEEDGVYNFETVSYQPTSIAQVRWVCVPRGVDSTKVISGLWQLQGEFRTGPKTRLAQITITQFFGRHQWQRSSHLSWINETRLCKELSAVHLCVSYIGGW